MNKILAALATTVFCSTIMVSNVFAAENPTCVLMKFTDDTRFDRTESAATLSDMVMEKLVSTGKFNFKETKYINEDIEKLLYDERAHEFRNARRAINWGDYDSLFEGPGFNENKAQSIATARTGQVVSPSITKRIGYQHGAEYLIQGTIVNLGTGNWMNEDVAKAANYASQATQLFSSLGGASSALGALGPLAALAGAFGMTTTGIAVQADLRVIKASTGEVVWHKQVTGKDTQKQYSLFNVVKVGSTKLSNDMYYKAMDCTSSLITDALIADLDAGTLFLK